MSDAGLSFVPGYRPPSKPTVQQFWLVYRGRQIAIDPDRGIAPGPDRESDVDTESIHYLGRHEGWDVFAADVAPHAGPPPGLEFRELFSLYGKMSDSIQKLTGRAIQVLEWDRTHRFCGACGSRTETAERERARVCPSCRLQFFPRVAPSMIVAVERDHQILLARSPRFPPGVWSVLAGFVEPGESVEDTIHREVFEEAGVQVRDIHYFGSQPWPHPHSLMLGYQARYAGGEITIDGQEIVEAGWVRADEMPGLCRGDFSIAQWMIRDFLGRQRV